MDVWQGLAIKEGLKWPCAWSLGSVDVSRATPTPESRIPTDGAASFHKRYQDILFHRNHGPFAPVT